MNFVTVGEEEEFIVFQKLNDFDDVDRLLPELVVLEFIGALDGVHSVSIFGKEIPDSLMIFAE